MGIFDRFSALLKSNINDLISRAEDPEKMLTQILVDMRGQLVKAFVVPAAGVEPSDQLARRLQLGVPEPQREQVRCDLVQPQVIEAKLAEFDRLLDESSAPKQDAVQGTPVQDRPLATVGAV